MKPVITREQARAVTTAFLQRHAQPTVRVWSVERVVDGSELTGVPPRTDYGAPRIEWEKAWVAYCKTPGPVMLKSSDIVVMSKETGEILYFGSANDEG
jgi:hypothetical protein